MSPPHKLLYTVNEAADLLCIGRSNLYRLIGDGSLQAKKLGGRTVFSAEDIRAFIGNLPVVERGGDKVG